jgi:hypothetical protein
MVEPDFLSKNLLDVILPRDAAGVVGVVVWPVWFAMDAKGAAGAEMDALKARQQYLAALAEQRCPRSPGPPPLYQPPRR